MELYLMDSKTKTHEYENEDDKVDKISFKSILIFLGKFFLWGIVGTIFFGYP